MDNIGKGLSQLMMIMADAMSFEFIVNTLEEAVKEYKLVPTDENKARLDSACHLYDLKNTITQVGGVAKMMEKMDHLDKASGLLDISVKGSN